MGLGDWVGVSDSGGVLRKITKKLQKMYQKEHPAPQKPEVLHEKLKIVLPLGILKKKSRPPTSPNFKTHKKFFLHFFTYIENLAKTLPITC